MKQILITAFEPFGGEIVNTSAAVLDLLPDTIAGYSARKAILPVAFGKAAEKAMRFPVDYIFLLGEAGNRDRITPELQARNLRNARIPDNEGYQPLNQPILPGAQALWHTPVPVRFIVRRMQEEGYPIAASEDAGAYVCNDTFYLVGLNSGAVVDFIHVPRTGENVSKLADVICRFIELAMQSFS